MSFDFTIARLRRALQNRLEARAHARRGHRFYQQSEFGQAIAEYEQSLERQPDQPFVAFNLGLALYKAGRKADARARWQAVLAQTEHAQPYLAEQARIMLRQFG